MGNGNVYNGFDYRRLTHKLVSLGAFLHTGIRNVKAVKFLSVSRKHRKNQPLFIFYIQKNPIFS